MGNNLGGRPKKIEKSGVWLTVRLTETENAELQKMMSEHGLTSRTKFVKSCIFGGKVKFVAVDNSSLEANARLAEVAAQLRSIGVNHNQAVKHLHTIFGDVKAANIVRHMAKNYGEVLKQLEVAVAIAEDVRKRVYSTNA